MLSILAQATSVAQEKAVREFAERWLDPTGWSEAVTTYSTEITWGGVGLLLLGVLFLLLGVKLTRPLVTLGFVLQGAVGGLMLGVALDQQYDVGFLPIVGAAVGAAISGVMGFFLYRIWMVLALAGLLSLVGMAGYMAIETGDELTDAGQAIRRVHTDVWKIHKEATKLEGQPKTPVTAAKAADLKQRGQRLRDRVEDWESPIERYARRHGWKIALSSLGGFVVGILLGIFLFRPTIILITAVSGVGLIYAAAMLIGQVNNHRWLDFAQDMGIHIVWVLGALLLIGMTVQFLLLPKKKAGQDATDADNANTTSEGEG